MFISLSFVKCTFLIYNSDLAGFFFTFPLVLWRYHQSVFPTFWKVTFISFALPYRYCVFLSLATFKIFSLALDYNSLTKMYLCGIFFVFILLSVHELLRPINWCFSANLRSFQPLFFQFVLFLLFYPILSYLASWDSNYMYVRLIAIISQTAVALFKFLLSHFSLFLRFNNFY